MRKPVVAIEDGIASRLPLKREKGDVLFFRLSDSF